MPHDRVWFESQGGTAGMAANAACRPSPVPARVHLDRRNAPMLAPGPGSGVQSPTLMRLCRNAM